VLWLTIKSLPGDLNAYELLRILIEFLINYLFNISRGPGTAFLFALTIIEQLLGKEVCDEVSAPMILASTL